MTIHSLNIYIPTGTHSYNGHSWIVDSNNIYKSVPFYPNKFTIIYTIGQDSIDCILSMEIKGLARTLATK